MEERDEPDRIEEACSLPVEATGQRLDRALAQALPTYSRSRLQTWIREGRVRLDGRVVTRPREAVTGGELVELSAVLLAETPLEPEPMDLDVLHEDSALLVLNKPAGCVVHPGAGNWSGTLVNGLLHWDPALEALPRAGIVHRLDKDTTGVMVVARTLAAHHDLVRQLQARSVRRAYVAVVSGTPTAGGRVDAAIGRHPKDRKRMAVVHDGRPAVTHYRIRERFAAHTALDCQLETGRTHQIRVHMAHAGYPLVGDPVYGGRPRFPKGASEAVRDALGHFPRQALHARSLALTHPDTGEDVAWEAALPADLETLLGTLRVG